MADGAPRAATPGAPCRNGAIILTISGRLAGASAGKAGNADLVRVCGLDALDGRRPLQMVRRQRNVDPLAAVR